MPDPVRYDGKGQNGARIIIKTIDNSKDQNRLHGFIAEALGVNELRLFLSRRIVILRFVNHWKSVRLSIIRV